MQAAESSPALQIPRSAQGSQSRSSSARFLILIFHSAAGSILKATKHWSNIALIHAEYECVLNAHGIRVPDRYKMFACLAEQGSTDDLAVLHGVNLSVGNTIVSVAALK
jgi:hypothetical protein